MTPEPDHAGDLVTAMREIREIELEGQVEFYRSALENLAEILTVPSVDDVLAAYTKALKLVDETLASEVKLVARMDLP
jgi:hypothetical protein